MYCNNCGKKSSGGKFCSSCGNKLISINDVEMNENRNLKSDSLSNKNEFNDNINNFKAINSKTFEELLADNIDKYCDKYKGGKKGMTLERYLNTANLLPSMRTTSFLIPIILLSIPFSPVGGMFFGGALGLFIYVFRCSRILRKENTLQVKCNYDINKIKETYNYMLKDNKISDLIIDSYDEEGINIIYKNQTHHKVKFYKDEGMYIVYCGRCTKKQYIKSGFQHSSSIMMRNSVLINPILRAYCEYTIK